MSTTFKVGDRVRRTLAHFAYDNRPEGYEFIVTDVKEDRVFEGVVAHGEYNLELVETKEEEVTFKKGDLIRAIETSLGNFITKGKTYVALDDQLNSGAILIQRDDGPESLVFAHRFELVTPATETYDTYTPAMLPMFTRLAEEADARGYCEQYDSLASVVGAPSRAEIKKLNAPADPLAAAREAFAAIPLGHTFHFTTSDLDPERRHIKTSETHYLHHWGSAEYNNETSAIEDFLRHGIEAN